MRGIQTATFIKHHAACDHEIGCAAGDAARLVVRLHGGIAGHGFRHRLQRRAVRVLSGVAAAHGRFDGVEVVLEGLTVHRVAR